MEQQKQQTKRKNSGFYALVALLLIITIVASGVGIYAWAKYTSSQNGSANAQVAKWSFNVNLKKGGNTVALSSEAIDLATTASHVTNGRIAPGTSGTFDIEIDTTGTEVDMQYEVTLGLTYCPRNITFSRKTGESGGQDVFTPISEGGAASLTRTGITFSEYVANDAQNRVITERIKWDWPYEDANDDDYDTRDKEDEIAITDANHHTTMTISVTGTEMLINMAEMGGDPTAPNSVQSLAKAGTIQRFDSINYNPGNGTTASLTLPGDISVVNNQYVAAVISAAESDDWVVLDVNETTGEVLIVPRTFSNIRLNIDGKNGYDNVIDALNMVASIYVNSTYAKSARSLNIDDVNKLENYTPSGEAKTKKYETRYVADSNLDIVDTGTEAEQTYSTNAITEAYYYNTEKISLYEVGLASRYLDLDQSDEYCVFGFRVFDWEGVITNCDLWSSDNEEIGGYQIRVLPVVSLKPGIQLQQNGTYEYEHSTDMIGEDGEYNVWEIQ